MKERLITMGLGFVLLNRNEKIVVNGKHTFPLYEEAKMSLEWWKVCGHKMFIICRINRGTEERVKIHLRLTGIMPQIISEKNIIFCYEEEEKGKVAAKIERQILKPIDVHIDDHVKDLNSINDIGVMHKILFIEGHDDRKNEELSFSDVLIAKDWRDVSHFVHYLPK